MFFARSDERDDILISIAVEKVTLTLFGHTFEVNFLYLVSLGLLLLVSLIAILIRYLVIPKFKEEPKGFQLLLETAVQSCDKFSRSILGEAGKNLGPWIFTLAVFIIFNGWIEFFGVRTPLSDLSLTAAMGLCTFGMINYFAIKRYGVIGRLGRLGKPIKFLAPIKVLTDCAVPVSLACRLFGNMLGGYIIMDLVYRLMLMLVEKYAVLILPVALAGAFPGILSLYFSVFHVLIQFYVFSMLSLSYIDEALE